MIGRPILAILLSAAAVSGAVGAIVAQAGDPNPGDVVRQAVAAVERDSVAALRARWSARAASDRSGPDARVARLGLATLDRLTYDYDAAERALAALAGGPRDAVATYAQLGRAEAANARGELSQADSLAAGARLLARATGDAEAEGRALLLLALTRGPTLGLDTAFVLLDGAERVLPARATDVRAELLRFRAVLLAVAADFDSANVVVERCLDAAREAGLLRATAQCHRSHALAYRLRAVDDSAVILLDEVERLQRAAHDNSALAESMLRRSDALRSRGLFGEAVRAMHEARDLALQTGNAFALGSAYNGLGSIALRLRDYPTAARELEEAARLFEAADDIGSYMGVVSFRSVLDAATGDLPTARRRAREAVDHYHQIGDVSEELAMLRHLASIEIREGNWAAAEAVLAEADALTRRAGQHELRVNLDFDRGRLALGRGRLDDAERHFERYRVRLDSAAHVLHYVTRAYLADIHARRGDLARAEHEITAAGDALDAWRATLPDDRLRLHAFQAVGNDTDSHDPSTERVLAALAAGGRAEAALALAERRRARTLADRMAQGEAMRLGDAPRRDSVRATPRLTNAAARGAGTRSVLDAAATGRAIAAALPDDRTALLEYVSGNAGAPTTLIVATREGIRAHLLPPADSLAPVIERFVTLLEGGDAPVGLSRTLGATLLAPAVAALDERVDRLVVVPDGPLHRVPFDALTLPDGRWAVERYSVSLAPSATVAATLWNRPRRSATGAARILALGDPVFG
ncbi:MAG TPA: CHAT domain-containing protein, partial [Gemmatimonadaceae bacterium]|nr:CHAT domain-containing protein [Gemmatimonadaceae bacterium]